MVRGLPATLPQDRQRARLVERARVRAAELHQRHPVRRARSRWRSGRIALRAPDLLPAEAGALMLIFAAALLIVFGIAFYLVGMFGFATTGLFLVIVGVATIA